MELQSFKNTVGIDGLHLEVAEIQAKGLENIILRIFIHYNTSRFTPYQIQEKLWYFGRYDMITSVRRALSDLTEAGKIYKSPKADVREKYAMPNHTWSLQPYEEERKAA